MDITFAGWDANSRASRISLRPHVEFPEPESIMSVVKARLFSVMPSVIAPLSGDDKLKKHSLKEGPPEFSISWRDRIYVEPKWYIDCGNLFGPLGFRSGYWDEELGEYVFFLVQTFKKGRQHPEIFDAYRAVTDRVVKEYREKSKHIDF